MSFSLRHSRSLDRKRRRRRFLKWIFVAGALFGLGIAAYQSGSTLARREVVRLQEEVDALRRQVEGLRRQNAVLASDAGDARTRQRELQQRYDADVPTGNARVLLDLVRERLSAGVSPERLEFMISSATEKPECDGSPVTKRFLVRTPLSSGANDSVSFADRTLTVSASGESATTEGGAPQAWYDPAKPVAISLTALGGETVRIDGKLPLHKSLVHNGSEYRFTAETGERRGFMDVTADRCNFPG